MPKKPPPLTVRRDDYDTPWKDVRDRWHRQFLEFFFPLAAADIDWSRGYEFLDKELQKVTRRAVVGRRHVDKLIKVWRRSGEETWVLIHTEVQGQREADFPRRLYTYHSRLTDRYNRPVARLEHKIGLTRRLYRLGLERSDRILTAQTIDEVLH